MQPVVMLVIAGVAMFSVIGGVSLLSHYYTLNGIKSRTPKTAQVRMMKMTLILKMLFARKR